MTKTERIILYVDDDEDDREIVSQTIQDLDPGVKVIAAEDGTSAIEFLATAKATKAIPCLVILDLNMPRMDGKRTLAEIKKDEEFKNLPVVIFTTSSARTDQAFCDYYGVTMFSKPSSLATIKQEVAQMLAYCAEV